MTATPADQVSPLDTAARAFALLTQPPAPLAYDTRTIPGLPGQVLPLDELAALLIADATSREARDLVWAGLVTRARRDGPAWTIATVGIALPGLRRRARRLRGAWSAEVNDLHSDLLLGFLQRLRSIDITEPRICSRLLDAAARTVKASTHHGDRHPYLTPTVPASNTPARPWGHPDLVLAHAVRTAIIGPEEAHLIGATRLEHQSLSQAATELGITTATARTWRHNGETQLAHALRHGH